MKVEICIQRYGGRKQRTKSETPTSSLHLQLQRPDEAVQQISSITRKYPNYAEAHAALAAIFWSQGKRARAEGELNAATNQEPRLRTIK